MIAETRAFRGICALVAAVAGIAAMVGGGLTSAYGQGDGEIGCFLTFGIAATC